MLAFRRSTYATNPTLPPYAAHSTKKFKCPLHSPSSGRSDSRILVLLLLVARPLCIQATYHHSCSTSSRGRSSIRLHRKQKSFVTPHHVKAFQSPSLPSLTSVEKSIVLLVTPFVNSLVVSCSPPPDHARKLRPIAKHKMSGLYFTSFIPPPLHRRSSLLPLRAPLITASSCLLASAHSESHQDELYLTFFTPAPVPFRSDLRITAKS